MNYPLQHFAAQIGFPLVSHGRNKVYEIRDHSPGIWDHNTWDRDQQCFSGIRDQNCERFWDQGSKFPMFLWSGIKILNVFVIRKNTGSVMKKYTLLRPCVSDPTKKNIVRRRSDCSPWSLKYNRFIVRQGPSGQMRNLWNMKSLCCRDL